MKSFLTLLQRHRLILSLSLLVFVIVGGLYSWRLGTITPGISLREQTVAHGIYGWHGIFNEPFYAPLNVLRSIIATLFDDPGALLLRLPSVLIGLVAVAAFALIVYEWFGARISFMATSLFLCSAWTLHVARLGTNEVLYIAAVPVLLALQSRLPDAEDRPLLLYFAASVWGMMLYIPGLVWLVIASIIFNGRNIKEGWRALKNWPTKAMLILTGMAWLPLLVMHLSRSSHNVLTWIGLHDDLPALSIYLKHLVGVGVHIVVRGPQYPDVWLSNSPVLDIFCLSMVVLGLYVYFTHLKSRRTQTVAVFTIFGVLLASLHEAAGFSLLMPILFFLVATGIAYLIKQWLHTFPLNPLARAVGIGLVTAVVLMSCAYNLRAYFVAWPHASETRQTFRYQP